MISEKNVSALRKIRDEQGQRCTDYTLMRAGLVESDEEGFWQITPAGEALLEMADIAYSKYPTRAPKDWDGAQWLRQKKAEQSVSGWKLADAIAEEVEGAPGGALWKKRAADKWVTRLEGHSKDSYELVYFPDSGVEVACITCGHACLDWRYEYGGVHAENQSPVGVDGNEDVREVQRLIEKLHTLGAP